MWRLVVSHLCYMCIICLLMVLHGILSKTHSAHQECLHIGLRAVCGLGSYASHFVLVSSIWYTLVTTVCGRKKLTMSEYTVNTMFLICHKAHAHALNVGRVLHRQNVGQYLHFRSPVGAARVCFLELVVFWFLHSKSSRLLPRDKHICLCMCRDEEIIVPDKHGALNRENYPGIPVFGHSWLWEEETTLLPCVLQWNLCIGVTL